MQTDATWTLSLQLCGRPNRVSGPLLIHHTYSCAALNLLWHTGYYCSEQHSHQLWFDYPFCSRVQWWFDIKLSIL